MKHGFVKVAVATPNLRVADCEYNVAQMKDVIQKADQQKVKLLVFPELGITGYTCNDLFLQDTLLTGALDGLRELIEYSENYEMLFFVGLPMMKQTNLYNVAAAICQGKLLGVVPKRYIPNYSEFYEARYFHPGNDTIDSIQLFGKAVPFGCKLLFECAELKDFIVGSEICEDLWVPLPPSTGLATAGATVLVNLSASDETTGKDGYRKELVKNQSARLISAYLYSSAGDGESTTDLVFSGHNIIAENGSILCESKRFKNGLITTEIDLQRLKNERRRISTYCVDSTGYETVEFHLPSCLTLPITQLTRFVDKSPFVPSYLDERKKRCHEITMIQAMGLKKRIEHIGIKHVVVGISGGLDSTLALLVVAKAFDLLGLDHSGIIAVTMPCFGTTDRTYQNALTLIKELGATLLEIPINEAVLQHFKDINHDKSVHDLTFENSQARERTQVLMDVACQYNGIVVGTGDMSELALGFATYNGDHMSMYGVNASVPKTLVRYLVSYFAEETKQEELKRVLLDILDTPVSPELLPPKEGEISQKTEDIVGPYELHDFFLYYLMRFGYTPDKIYRLAVYAFEGDYTKEIILKWLKTFYHRFFAQQFKRSCLPDGPKVGSVAVSPRGDLRMPSDACMTLWKKELDAL